MAKWVRNMSTGAIWHVEDAFAEMLFAGPEKSGRDPYEEVGGPDGSTVAPVAPVVNTETEETSDAEPTTTSDGGPDSSGSRPDKRPRKRR